MQMTNMKAAVYYQYGPPELIQVKEIPKPIPNDDEVLVRVHATTVNRTDCAILRAHPFIMRFFTGLTKPSNPILGTDFAGMVEGLGNSVKGFKIGDRIFGFTDQGMSSQAEYLVCKTEKFISHMSKNVSFQQAAASIEGAHYAINFINKVKLEKGQRAFVNGASGAIGSAMVQLLKYQGLHVTATCTYKNLGLISSLGVDKVIDYEKEDFTLIGETFDYVFDAVGKSSFGKCKPILKPKGIYISSELGPKNQNPILALVTPLMGGKQVKFPFPSDIKTSLALMKKMMEEGKFMPLIDREYSFDDISKAYAYVETGQKTGTVTINLL
ncbi:NAD(P)-dependent alcohol dehydrogenase [Aquiflexum gelatinilyticum]|uniref:NAD(P)-dependent alcohol dehydrogenase n=1 Tax=Aquiflexum gelatinilyticum TaxID=2961943 RepID=UPI002168BB33|nr:NAD(P)-dependent alcohol dehydrogenase [Aquiflexum gelatinilyticum]MCS4433007.1 NAD(P)-dependent alcohol dehydrogenase [Aquiflexum gelatinilyticum]